MKQKRLVLPLSPKSVLRQLLDDPRSDDKLKARILRMLRKPLGWKVLSTGRPRVTGSDFAVTSARRIITDRSVDPALRFQALLDAAE